MAKTYQLSVDVMINGNIVRDIRLQVISIQTIKPTTEDVKKGLEAAFPGKKIGTIQKFSVI